MRKSSLHIEKINESMEELMNDAFSVSQYSLSDCSRRPVNFGDNERMKFSMFGQILVRKMAEMPEEELRSLFLGVKRVRVRSSGVCPYPDNAKI